MESFKSCERKFYSEDEESSTAYSAITPEQISHDCDDGKLPVYRSADISDCVNVVTNNFISKPTLQKAERSMKHMNKPSQPKIDLSLGDRLLPPEKPYFVKSTNFICSMALRDLIARISSCLVEISDLSCTFDENACTWSAVSVRPSGCCKLQIHIYTHGGLGSYMVEVSRLMGDASSLYSVFNELRVSLGGHIEEFRGRSDSFAGANPLPMLDDTLPDMEVQRALAPIICMARDPYMDTQLEASRILCDLSHHDGIQQQLCENGVISILVALLTSSCEFARQNAMLALTNLSMLQLYQEAIVHSGVLPRLLDLSTDGTYQTHEMRLHATRILANLAMRLPDQVASEIGTPRLTNWLHTVDKISDGKLRFHADKAKCALMSTIYAN